MPPRQTNICFNTIDLNSSAGTHLERHRQCRFPPVRAHIARLPCRTEAAIGGRRSRQPEQIRRLDGPARTAVPGYGKNHLGSSRSEEHTSEPQSLMRNSSAVFCLTKKKNTKHA